MKGNDIMREIRYSVECGSFIEVEDDATLDEIYDAIDEDAKSIGLEGDVTWVYDATNGKEL